MSSKLILKIILFSMGIIVLFSYLTKLLVLKKYAVGANINILISPYVLCEKQDGFYNLEPNTLDAVFIGSSNVHCNINPNVIWNDYGISSYDFCCDQQELGTSFYYLKQVFEDQSPSVVVIDILNGGSEEYINTIQAHYAFDHMKNDIYKFQAIWNRTKNDRLEMLFPLITYHERWNQLDEDDFKYKSNVHNVLNGCFIYMITNEQERPIIPVTIPDIELSDRTKYWIDSIVQECSKNNCKCVFIKTPLAYYDEEKYMYFVAFGDYCEQLGVPFLNLNDYVDDIGIDYSVDYADKAHMNWNGQKKLSIYLGKYLSSNYFLEKEKTEDPIRDDDYETMMYYLNSYIETN